MLTYRFRRYFPFGPRNVSTDVILESDGMCDSPHWKWDEATRANTDTPAATLAHVGFEIVAITLAAPLRRAYEKHLGEAEAEHKRLGGMAYCGECSRLLALLPEADRPVIYG